MINYKGTPLFGPDSSVQHTSEFFAIAGTILFWILFLIFSFVIKPQPKKPEYKEVQIVLSSTPVVQKTEESPAPAEQAAAPSAAASAQAEEAPISPIVETPAPKAQPKPTPKKAEPAKPSAQPKSTAKPVTTTSEPTKLAKSVDDLIAEMNTSSSKTVISDEDFDKMFDDNDFDSSNTTEKKTVTTKSSSTGTAGESASDKSQKLTSSSSGSENTQTVSSDTTKTLHNIKNSTYAGKALNGIQSKTEVQTVNSGSGKVTVPMSNGRSRALIDPEEPIINIPPELYYLIDSTRTVKISFKVINSGNVTDVRISPESSLHSSIRQEIIGQLLFWRFEAADYTATANFEYTIIKQ